MNDKPKLSWIVRDNAGHDVVSYEIDDDRFEKNPLESLYGVTFYTLTLDQRDSIRRVVEQWNALTVTEVGLDPLKLFGVARIARNTVAEARRHLSVAATVHQEGVPHQMALVWRSDLSNLCTDHARCEAELEIASREASEARLIGAHLVDPGEHEKVCRGLVELKLRCNQCICEGATDECCPQCIPGPSGDIFQRYEAAVKLIEKVRAVANSDDFLGLFTFALVHNQAYSGGNWKAELDEFDRICAGASGAKKD